MHLLFTICIRNLLRQKRRSILLGTAIMFGTAVLVFANAFAHGITEVIFNEILPHLVGHISLSCTKEGNTYNQVFHDGERMRAIIKKRVPAVKQIDEAIGTFVKAVGNGKADRVLITGMTKALEKGFKPVAGNFENLFDSTIENPTGLSVEKAKSLNVGYNDIFRIRYIDLNGQTQAARLTVSLIYKPLNVLMSEPLYMDIKSYKRLLGYGSHDITAMFLTIGNPKKNAKRFADSLHAGLHPPLAVIDGELTTTRTTVAATLLALRTDSASLSIADAALRLVSRTATDSINRKRSVIISSVLATSTGLRSGDTCSVRFAGKFDSISTPARLIVTAIAATGCGVDGMAVLVNEKDFYRTFYNTWPKSAATQPGPFRPDSTVRLYKALGGEWLLVPRTKTTDAYLKLSREIAQKGWKAIVVQVDTMYETASMVVNLEYVLNLITIVCVMLLFFIIFIGVVNTLQMTIRERTREIGTMRAIGMQHLDVQNLFLIETGTLALIASMTGTLVAFMVMWGLSQIPIKQEDNPLSLLLVDGHLFFAPSVVSVIVVNVMIVCIAVITAFSPARRAARLSAADALRHFE